MAVTLSLPTIIMRLLKLLLPLLLVQITSAADVPTKRVRLNDFYTVIPMPRNQQMDSSWWGLKAALNAASAGADTCDELVSHFRGADAPATKHGVFVHSYTHSTHYSQTELKKLPQSILDQLNHQAWRELENKMVSDLVAIGNKEGIPVWILVRATGEMYTYKLITDPKLTFKK